MNKFLNYKNSHLVLYAGLVLSCLVAAIYFCMEITAIAVLGLLIFVMSLLQAVIFYKCPYCKRGWDYRTQIPDYCPHCGHEIEY